VENGTVTNNLSVTSQTSSSTVSNEYVGGVLTDQAATQATINYTGTNTLTAVVIANNGTVTASNAVVVENGRVANNLWVSSLTNSSTVNNEYVGGILTNQAATLAAIHYTDTNTLTAVVTANDGTVAPSTAETVEDGRVDNKQ